MSEVDARVVKGNKLIPFRAATDCAKITIGDRCMFAPNVQIYAATHSVEVAERVAGLERAYPVTVRCSLSLGSAKAEGGTDVKCLLLLQIGDDCWMGGNSVIIGPSTIGNGCTVAAGSVVRSRGRVALRRSHPGRRRTHPECCTRLTYSSLFSSGPRCVPGQCGDWRYSCEDLETPRCRAVAQVELTKQEKKLDIRSQVC